jgi:hypothetical protein
VWIIFVQYRFSSARRRKAQGRAQLRRQITRTIAVRPQRNNAMAKSFKGTHLEGQPRYLQEIEELDSGGWAAQGGRPRWVGTWNTAVKIGAATSVKPSFGPMGSSSRSVRLIEPRAAPQRSKAVRTHHFEMKTILAENRGGRSVAEVRSAYQTGGGLDDMDVNVRASSAAHYMEGNEHSEGDRVAYIAATTGQTNEERQSFWKLANDNANMVCDHRISIDTRADKEAWSNLAKERNLPFDLRRAIKVAQQGDDTAQIVVNDAGVTKRWLERRKNSLPQSIKDSIKLETPRNDRVGYSFIGQYPFGLSMEGRVRCTDRWMAKWTQMGIPAQAVMHEPTTANDKRNHHFHGQIYRGCARQQTDGRWSFERINVRNEHRTMKSVPLERLGVPAIFKDKHLIRNLKREWQEIVNSEAARECLAVRFTDEKNADRGMPQAQARVAPSVFAMAKKGWFGDKMVQSNLASWDALEKNEVQARDDQRHRLLQRVDEAAASLSLDPTQMDLANVVLREQGNAEIRMVEAERVSIKAAKLALMLRSGPEAIIECYTPTARKSDAAANTVKRKDKREVARAHVALANDYLTFIQPELINLELIRDTARADAARERAALFELAAEFEALHGPVSEVLVPLRKSEIAPKSDPLLDTQNSRTADRDARNAAIAASRNTTQF